MTTAAIGTTRTFRDVRFPVATSCKADLGLLLGQGA